MKLSVALSMMLVCAFASGAFAQEPLRVFASNGVKAVAEDLKKAAEKSVGRPIALTFDSTAGLRKKIAAGEAWDAALLTSDAVDAMIKDGTLNGATRADLARVGVGVGYTAGAKKPDVKTAAGMAKALTEAKSITYAADGASRVFVDGMIAKLKLTESLKPKTVLAQGSGPATASVASGKVDLVLTLVSEILPVEHLSLAGEIPAEFQAYVTFSAAANAKSKETEAVKKLIAAFRAPAVGMIYKARGMEMR